MCGDHLKCFQVLLALSMLGWVNGRIEPFTYEVITGTETKQATSLNTPPDIKPTEMIMATTATIVNYSFDTDPNNTPFKNDPTATTSGGKVMAFKKTECIPFRKILRLPYMTQGKFSLLTGRTELFKPRKRSYPISVGNFKVSSSSEQAAWDVGADYAPTVSNFRKKDETTAEVKNLLDLPITTRGQPNLFKWWQLDYQGMLHVSIEGKTEVRHIVFDRRSFLGPYMISKSGHPLNPMGATGIVGMGELWRWGPNPATDFLLYRYKRDKNGAYCEPKVLEGTFIIRREQVHGFVGGFVDAWEAGDRWITGVHELFEEMFNCLVQEKNDAARFKAIRDAFDELVHCSSPTVVPEYQLPRIKVIYQGYSDDPRNTDNAWVETSLFAINVDNTKFEKFLLNKPPGWQKASDDDIKAYDPTNSETIPEGWKYWEAGDGAKEVHWKGLYDFLKEIVAEKNNDKIDDKKKKTLFAGHGSLVAEFLYQFYKNSTNEPNPAAIPHYDFVNFQSQVHKTVDTLTEKAGLQNFNIWFPLLAPKITPSAHYKYKFDGNQDMAQLLRQQENVAIAG